MPEVEEGKEEVGVQEDGKPAEEPASKPTEQAEPDDGVVVLDVTKKYRSKRNPAQEVPGDEIWAGYGRGLQYDKLQSEHQKLQTASSEKDTRIAALEAQVASSEAKEQVAQAIQDAGLTGGQKPVAEAGDEWLDTEQPPAPTVLDAKATASRIDLVTKQTVENYLANLAPELKEAAMGVGLQQQEERELQAQRKETVDQLKAVKIATLKVEYPDAIDGDIEDLATRMVEYAGHIYKAVDLYATKNVAEGNESLFDGEEKLQAMFKKQAALGAQQAKINTEREQEAELEGINAGILPGETGEPEERKMAFKRSDVEKNREKGLSKAHKVLDRIGLLKNQGM